MYQAKQHDQKSKTTKKKSKNKNDAQPWQYYYYTIHAIMSNHIVNANPLFSAYINSTMETLLGEIELAKLVKMGDTLIEKNDMLLK